MKINCGLMLKRGDGDYGSAAPSCSIELDVPDEMAKNTELLRQQIRNLQTICRVSCEEELKILLPKPKPAVAVPVRRQAGDDVDVEVDQTGEDLQPGDRGYHGPADDYEREDDLAPYRGRDVPRPQRRDDGPPPSRRDDDRPPPRPNDDRRGGGGGRGRQHGAPTNAKQFTGWFQSLKDLGDEGREMRNAVIRILKAWNYPTMTQELTNDEAMAVYHEFTNGKHDAVRSGNANGRSWGGGNGRDDRGRR